MNDSVENLSAVDVAVAAVLVLVAGAVSLGLRLGLERRLAWASVRTVAQLLLVGYILKWVFGIVPFFVENTISHQLHWKVMP